MATVKLALKFRGITYPTYQSKNKSDKKRHHLQRMNSFDLPDDASLITREDSRRREVSAEGRSRVRLFQNSHSTSTDTTTTSSLSPHRRSLRQSVDTCSSTLSEREENTSFDQSNMATASWRRSDVDHHHHRVMTSTTCERLIDWRRRSPERRCVGRSQSYDTMTTQRQCRSPDKRSLENSSNAGRRRLHSSTSVPPPLAKCPPVERYPSKPAAAAVDSGLSNEGRQGRLQFRRALSLFSISCHGKESERQLREGKSPQKKILRPPTRHVYRRGLSGLPIQCTSKSLGLAY